MTVLQGGQGTNSFDQRCHRFVPKHPLYHLAIGSTSSLQNPHPIDKHGISWPRAPKNLPTWAAVPPTTPQGPKWRQQKGLFPINLFEFPSVMTNKPVTNWSSFGPRSCSLFFLGCFFVTKGTSCNATELDLTQTLPLLDSPKGSASNHSVGDTPSLCKVP